MNLIVKMNIRTKLVCSLILLSFLGCKREVQLPYYKINNDFLQYVYFEKGSYWIYKNECNGTHDSCTLIYPPNVWTAKPEGLGYTYEAITTGFISKFLSNSEILATPDFDFAVFEEMDSHSLISIRTSMSTGQKYTFDGAVIEQVALFDSIIINDSIFKNVIHTRVAQPNNLKDSIFYSYFFAKNIGLIKFEKRYLNTDTTWSLLRYQVVQ